MAENRLVRIEDWQGNVYNPKNNFYSGVVIDSSDTTYTTEGTRIKRTTDDSNNGTALQAVWKFTVGTSNPPTITVFSKVFKDVPLGCLSVDLRIKCPMDKVSGTDVLPLHNGTYVTVTFTPVDDNYSYDKLYMYDRFGSKTEYFEIAEKDIAVYKGSGEKSKYSTINIKVNNYFKYIANDTKCNIKMEVLFSPNYMYEAVSSGEEITRTLLLDQISIRALSELDQSNKTVDNFYSGILIDANDNTFITHSSNAILTSMTDDSNNGTALFSRWTGTIGGTISEKLIFRKYFYDVPFGWLSCILRLRTPTEYGVTPHSGYYVKVRFYRVLTGNDSYNTPIDVKIGTYAISQEDIVSPLGYSTICIKVNNTVVDDDDQGSFNTVGYRDIRKNLTQFRMDIVFCPDTSTEGTEGTSVERILYFDQVFITAVTAPKIITVPIYET